MISLMISSYCSVLGVDIVLSAAGPADQLDLLTGVKENTYVWYFYVLYIYCKAGITIHLPVLMV